MVAVTLLLGLTGLAGCASAHPTGRFRASTEPFTSRAWQCWPLPAATAPDFPVLVRSRNIEHTGGLRRLQVTVQFFDVTPAGAEQRLESTITAGGFTVRPDGRDGLSFTKAGFGTATATVKPLPGVSADIPVRGVLTLNLPLTRATVSGRHVCPTQGRPIGAHT